MSITCGNFNNEARGCHACLNGPVDKMTEESCFQPQDVEATRPKVGTPGTLCFVCSECGAMHELRFPGPDPQVEVVMMGDSHIAELVEDLKDGGRDGRP